ncbi:hypothetical protein C3F00_045810, partial [Pseudomonas sp. MWU13-2860]
MERGDGALRPGQDHHAAGAGNRFQTDQPLHAGPDRQDRVGPGGAAVGRGERRQAGRPRLHRQAGRLRAEIGTAH